MLKPHDLPFTQAYATQARAFGADLSFLEGSLAGADDIRRAHGLRGRKGQPLCLFEPSLGMLVISQQARGELAPLTQGLARLERPARVLLCPEDSAARVIKSLESAQGTRFAFQRRKKLLFREALPFPDDPPPPPASRPLGRMRPAGPADAAALAALIDTQEGEMLDPETLAEGLAAGGRAFLWEREEILAVAALGCEDEASLDIHSVNTKPAARGEGLAFALLRRLIAERVFPKAACVLVEEENAPALALYRKLGFKFACAWRYAEAGS